MVGDEQATTGAENKKSLMRLLLVLSPGLMPLSNNKESV